MKTQPNISPIQKERGVDNIDECLKYSQHRCNCWLADNEKLKDRLRKLRNDLGLQSGLDWIDSGLVEEYGRQRKQLCEGRKATASEQWQTFINNLQQRFKK